MPNLGAVCRTLPDTGKLSLDGLMPAWMAGKQVKVTKNTKKTPNSCSQHCGKNKTATKGANSNKEIKLQHIPGWIKKISGHFSCGISHKHSDQCALKYLFPCLN